MKERYKVPMWMKIAFFWMAMLMLTGLTVFQIDKRRTYDRLRAYNAMQPVRKKNDVVPFFKVPKGNTGAWISLDNFGSKWVLLHFWATWCPPCRAEMPSLEVLHRSLSDKMVVLTISTDEDWADVQKFFGAGREPSFIAGWDKGQKVADLFGVDKYPETFLISPDRKIVARFMGPRAWDSKEAKAYLEATMKQPSKQAVKKL